MALVFVWEEKTHRSLFALSFPLGLDLPKNVLVISTLAKNWISYYRKKEDNILKKTSIYITGSVVEYFVTV